MDGVFVGLGSNLADPVTQLTSAIESLRRLPRTEVVRHSRFYSTDPWGLIEQPAFVNAVVELCTDLSARELLDGLLVIERKAGRVRDQRWGPRIIDLDILLFGDDVVDEPSLRIPHPHLHERAFALVPLVEIAPRARIPGRGTISEILSHIDVSTCRPLENVAAATK